MRRGLRIIAVLLLSLSSVLVWSQTRTADDGDAGPWDVYGGAAFTGNNPAGGNFGAGFGIDRRFTRWVGAAGEYTFVQTSCCVVNNIVLSDFLGGLRLHLPSSGRVRPFADFLAGGQYLSNSSNHHSWYYSNGGGPAIAADGGLDIALTRRLALRNEAGYVYSQFATFGGPSQSNNRWRAGVYLVFHF